MSDTPTRTRSQIKEDVKTDIMRAILDNIRINDKDGTTGNSPHNLERRVQARRVMEFLGFSSFPGMED